MVSRVRAGRRLNAERAGCTALRQVKAHLANWDATLFKSDEAADAAETKALAAAKAEFKKANETAEAASKKGNEARKNSTATAVEAAHAKLTKLMAERKARQFPIVAAAYAAAAQVCGCESRMRVWE